MSKNIYVGNLSPRTTQEEIRQLFEQYGQVDSVDFITDRYTGTRRGFGFVNMTDEGSRMAIAALDKQKVDGQTISVIEAIPRTTSERQPRGGWGGRRGSWSIDWVPYSFRPDPQLPR
jgi:cold-inducible RNA-binding protein